MTKMVLLDIGSLAVCSQFGKAPQTGSIISRDAPDSGFYYLAGYWISWIIKIILPDSGHVKPNMPSVCLSVNAHSNST